MIRVTRRRFVRDVAVGGISLGFLPLLAACGYAERQPITTKVGARTGQEATPGDPMPRATLPPVGVILTAQAADWATRAEVYRATHGVSLTPLPSPTQPSFNTRIVEATPAGVGRIVDVVNPPFSSSVFVARNQWQAQYDGSSLFVWAGRMGDDFLQGAVLVRVIPPHPALKVLGGQTPQRVGAVSIVGADGYVLLLQAEGSGAMFRFDVLTGTFLGQASGTPAVH